jgi:hypothetical protein
MRTLRLAVFAATASAFLAGPAFAEVLNYGADLTAAAEVPPTDSTGTGKVEATIDTDSKVFTWTVTYDGLTGPATAAHFHGPAAAGSNAGPQVPIEGDLASPIEGTATLTDEQLQQVRDGLWYFNVHTEQYPDGELRGQLVGTPAM